MTETNKNSTTGHIETGCGTLYVIINFTKDRKIKKIFAHLGKAGGCPSSHLDALSFMCKTAIRADVPVETIVRGLKGIGCHNRCDESTSCADGFAKVLEQKLGKEVGNVESVG